MTTAAVEANGARIPLLGLGTWDLRGKVCARNVEQAIRLGYRHIDTAAIYDNEREVGEGVRASGVPREEIFITTKVWSTRLSPPEFERSARESLVRLRLTSVDLLLIHWPNPSIPLAETIGALCKMKREGVARHIGISNFDVKLIEEAVRLATELLVCDQIELHPYTDRSDIIAACRRHGLAVVAYSPIARGEVARDPLLMQIGKRYRKSATQVCLRWLVQQGIPVIPRTSKVERLSSNADIFDFTLSDEDTAAIQTLTRRERRLVDF
jgi:2,5-diketo-D-gluconate reductase B